MPFTYTARASVNYVTYSYDQDGRCRRELGSFVMSSSGRDDSEGRAKDRLQGDIYRARSEGGFDFTLAPHHSNALTHVPWHQVYEIRYMETTMVKAPRVA